jgi:hypothetical protein
MTSGSRSGRDSPRIRRRASAEARPPRTAGAISNEKDSANAVTGARQVIERCDPQSDIVGRFVDRLAEQLLKS